MAEPLYTKNETMAPLHVATLTVQRELLKASRAYLCIKNKTMAPLHVATLTIQRELPIYLASRVSILPLYQE